MRIHTLLIAGALAGLMTTTGSTQAQGMTAPVHVASSPHKHKHQASEKHLAITKDGKTRKAAGTVSKELMGKSSKSLKHNVQPSRRFSKHHVKSSNAKMNKKHSTKSSSKSYQ